MNKFQELIRSRKFLVTLGAVVSYGLARIGLDVAPEDLALPIGAIGAWIVGHGIADSGKARAAAEKLAFEAAAASLEAAAARLERKMKELEPVTKRLPLTMPITPPVGHEP